MARNVLFFLLGAAIVVCAIGGYMVYQQHQTSGVEVSVSKNGLSVQTK
ncbi:MAG: hypothetical protein P4L98_20300 [Ancalomicrobiaceae bacterium]|nr:hypothetical protein [Ancalomicrobiaceae bacterium]